MNGGSRHEAVEQVDARTVRSLIDRLSDSRCDEDAMVYREAELDALFSLLDFADRAGGSGEADRHRVHGRLELARAAHDFAHESLVPEAIEALRVLLADLESGEPDTTG